LLAIANAQPFTSRFDLRRGFLDNRAVMQTLECPLQALMDLTVNKNAEYVFVHPNSLEVST
jgi:hypothetical protein